MHQPSIPNVHRHSPNEPEVPHTLSSSSTHWHRVTPNRTPPRRIRDWPGKMPRVLPRITRSWNISTSIRNASRSPCWARSIASRAGSVSAPTEAVSCIPGTVWRDLGWAPPRRRTGPGKVPSAAGFFSAVTGRTGKTRWLGDLEAGADQGWTGGSGPGGYPRGPLPAIATRTIENPGCSYHHG